MATRAQRRSLIGAQDALIAAMSTEELELLCAGEPVIDFTDFSIHEIDLLIAERASPALYAKLHKAEAEAAARGKEK
jgi:hypothetical protein